MVSLALAAIPVLRCLLGTTAGHPEQSDPVKHLAAETWLAKEQLQGTMNFRFNTSHMMTMRVCKNLYKLVNTPLSELTTALIAA
jgi:hypothetical protein